MLRLLHRWSALFAVLWAGIITVLSVMPGHELPEINIWEPDKVAHVIVYAVLGLLSGLAFHRYKNGQSEPGIDRSQSENLRRKAGLRALFVGVAYGVGIEIVQGTLIPSRVFDLFDILANFLGGLAGFWAYLYTALHLERGGALSA